jgi:hypothetical protein
VLFIFVVAVGVVLVEVLTVAVSVDVARSDEAGVVAPDAPTRLSHVDAGSFICCRLSKII